METPSSYRFTPLTLGEWMVFTNIGVGIPHASTEDFVYNGYFIPAGSTIHAMEW